MSAVATSGSVVPLLRLGNAGFAREYTPVLKGHQRFLIYARGGNSGPWGRPFASRLTRDAACSIAERRCASTGDWMRVEDTAPQGLAPVVEQWRPGFKGPVRETIVDADGKAVAR